MTNLLDSLKQRKEEFYDIYCDDRARPEKRLAALAIKTELEQIIAQVEGIGKALQEKRKRYNTEYAKGMKVADTAYFGGREDGLDDALDLLGYKEKQA
jgi:hypothetical protein